MQLIKKTAFPLALLLCGNVFATETNAFKSTEAPKKHASQLTCEEFLSIDEINRPKIIYWTVGQMKKGKPEHVDVLISRTDRLVPVVIEECKKNPKKHFGRKLKNIFKNELLICSTIDGALA